ncbi:MAG: zinc ribbon domain-containing protein [archaeon]
MSNVPRRMQRFYRSTNNSSKQNDVFRKEDPFSNTTRSLPSMDYEDIAIDETNYQEIKKIEKLNLEEKLALLEVKKFQQENKRLPNKKETETMADSLFTQFKETDSSNPPAQNPRSGRNRNEGHSRRDKARGNQKQPIQEELSLPQDNAPNTDIKDLFSDTSLSGTGKKGDDFDLGLDLESDEIGNINENIDDLDNLKSSPSNEKKCSNCGKPNEKTIFCPKCGTAFCENCAKSHDAQGYICPKCGAKSNA